MVDFREVILVVDDEEKVVRSIKAALEDIAPVVGVVSAEEALDAIETHEVGVAIVDQRMPEMSGADLLAAIRQRSPKTRRFVLTGYEDLGLGIYSSTWLTFGRYPKPPTALLIVREPDAPQEDPQIDRIVNLARSRGASVLELPNETIGHSDLIANSLPPGGEHAPALDALNDMLRIMITPQA